MQNARQSLHAQSSHFRALINKQGKLNVHSTREKHNPFADLYHYLFSLSWPKFFIYAAAVYVLINLFFAGLYLLSGVDKHFSQCFFLSVENMVAVDYGRAGPAGLVVHALMTVQAFLGLLTFAVITGLFYARFSRATARVIFSNKAIISRHNGAPCLFFRIANERLNQIAEARMTLHMTKNETSLEGEKTRKFYDLKLERDHTPLFSLSWTVRHFIDERSPLFGMDEAKMREAQMGVLASLTGTDETFSQPIIARHAYSMEDIVYNRRFKDIIIWHDKKVHIDLKGIHDLYEANTSGDS
ncbi:MAG: ATP-sensitive inward rectifier potassium channel 10 [Candidatus Omnitrophica bacterium]|nr:ATP-sensitive inward rectifier potassium channel 10 [Candidatus Omnitrophota bacterium]MDE2214730.1 ATP-sensitive inward rectifier potassium channel 10 [Candidatus Omnitrophota bacterium]